MKRSIPGDVNMIALLLVSLLIVGGRGAAAHDRLDESVDSEELPPSAEDRRCPNPAAVEPAAVRACVTDLGKTTFWLEHHRGGGLSFWRPTVDRVAVGVGVKEVWIGPGRTRLMVARAEVRDATLRDMGYPITMDAQGVPCVGNGACAATAANETWLAHLLLAAARREAAEERAALAAAHWTSRNVSVMAQSAALDRRERDIDTAARFLESAAIVRERHERFLAERRAKLAQPAVAGKLRELFADPKRAERLIFDGALELR